MWRPILVLSFALLTAAPATASYMEENTDRLGNDLRSIVLEVPNVGQCQAACDAEGACVGWTYVRPGVQGPRAVCWLKSAPGEPRANPCCISGLKNAVADPAAPPFTEACGPLKPMTEIVVQPAGTWLTDDTGWRFLTFSARGYAEAAKGIVAAYGYREMCAIGPMTYFFAPGGRNPAARPEEQTRFTEDCMAVNPAGLTILEDGGFMLVQGGTIVQRGFATRRDAEWARQALQRYGFTQRCSFRDLRDTPYWR